MSQGSNLNKLSELLKEQSKRQIPTQVFWGTVKEVDWKNRQCTVIGMTDDLDFYEVSLGLNDRVIKPVKDTKCIIGAVENSPTDLYLIDCEEFEEIIWISEAAEFHITKQGFVVKNKDANLKDILEKTYDYLNSAIIQTPSGPGNFSPGDVQKFNGLKGKVKKLFK